MHKMKKIKLGVAYLKREMYNYAKEKNGARRII